MLAQEQAEPTPKVDTVEPIATDLHALAWLAGTWISAEESGPQTVEHWLAPAGGMMLGANRTVHEGRAVFFEFLRIEATQEGIVYFASPKGRSPATAFTLVDLHEDVATFENAAHDFPQRIEYRRAGGRLTMTVSGTVDGQHKSSRWQMRRADPPSPLDP